jgi:hypothetical protein
MRKVYAHQEGLILNGKYRFLVCLEEANLFSK